MVWSLYQKNPSYFNNDSAELAVQISGTDAPYQNVFGFELSNIAYGLVCKEDGLANPFGGDTGATGWGAPGMVMLYALAFKLFGCFSLESILFMYALALCLSVLTIIMIFSACMHLFKSPQIACIASFLYALELHDVFIFKKTAQMDFNVYPFLFMLCFLFFLRCLHSHSMVDRCLFGLAAGVAILCNPVFVLPVSACCLYYMIVNRGTVMRAVRETAVVVMVCMFLLAPYILYQYQRLHTWSFIKSNGVFELYLGNVPDFGGVLTQDLFRKYHPSANLEEYRAYRDMGEKAYIHSKLPVFFDTFDPVRFVSLTFRRFLYFFFMFPDAKGGGGSLLHNLFYSLRGLALIAYVVMYFRRLRSVDALIYAYIFMYALPFCFMGIMYRYSFPIVPLSAILWGRVLCARQELGKRIKPYRC
jgi:hypothetical protein